MSQEVRPTQPLGHSHITPTVPIHPKRFRPDMLLAAVVLFSWVTVWRIQDLFPILASIKFPTLVEIVVLGLFFSDRSPDRRLKAIRSPILLITVILFGIMVLGLPFSLWPGKGFTFLTRDFLPTFLLMVVLATSMREASDLTWVAFANLIGGMLYSIEIYIHHPISSDGRLSNLVYYDANDFALLVVCTIPFAIYFMRPGVKLWKRLIATYSLVLFIVMIMKSGSRGGFLGLIAVMLFILFFYRAVPMKHRIGAVFGGAALLLTIGSSSYWTMMGTLLHPNDDYNMTADVGRKAVWKRGLGYMWTHPVLGVGIRAFPQAEGTLSKIAKKYAEQGRGIKWSVAHNSFVEIGAECGVFALALFLTMLVLTIRTLARVRAGPRGSPVATPDDTAFAQMLIASFIGYMVSGFFVSAEYFAYLYVLLGLFLGQHAILRRRTMHLRNVPQQPPPSLSSGGARLPVRRPIPAQWWPTGS